MTIESIYNQITEIEREIAVLPEGSITKKKIRGKDYFMGKGFAASGKAMA